MASVKQEGGEATCFPPLNTAERARRLVHANLYLPRLGLFSLGNLNLEYTVLVRGLNRVMLYTLRQREGSYEFSGNPFHRAILDTFSRLAKLPFASERQCPLLELQVEILFVHPGKFGSDHIGIFALENINSGMPGSAGCGVKARAVVIFIKQTVDP